MRYKDILLGKLTSLYITFNENKSSDFFPALASFTQGLKMILASHNFYFKNNLHKIVKVFITKVTGATSNSDHFVSIYILGLFLSLMLTITKNGNMQKLVQLLNSMTPENENMQKPTLENNMQKLLQLLNSMTPENMKKLLDLLNSMTPENIGTILQALNTKFDVRGINSDHYIGSLLSDHLKLNEESMSKLLDFYSFSEIKKSYPTGKFVRYDFICHKYKGGKTPFFKSISIGKEDSSTCKAIYVLNESIKIFTPFLKHMHGENNVEVRNEYDAKYTKADNECSGRYYQGGGKRKTLKKRRYNNK